MLLEFLAIFAAIILFYIGHRLDRIFKLHKETLKEQQSATRALWAMAEAVQQTAELEKEKIFKEDIQRAKKMSDFCNSEPIS